MVDIICQSSRPEGARDCFSEINAWGEEAFLETIEEVLEDF